MAATHSPAPLLAESQALLSMARGPSYDRLESVTAAREVSLRAAVALSGPYDYDGDVTELFIPSDQVPTGIPVSVYKSSNVRENPPILVYFHGGGNVLGSRQAVDTTCKMLSDSASCIVVNVEYRMGPEHRVPANFEDGEAVARWVLQNKKRLGGTAHSSVGIGGDSAGAKIAASVCQTMAGVDYQILIYGKFSKGMAYNSYETYKNGYLLDENIMQWFAANSLPIGLDASEPRLYPLLTDDLTNVPPALFVVAQCDPLADESYAYAERLTKAGIPNELYLSEGALHGFYTRPGHFKSLCADAYKRTVEFIKKYT